MKQILATFVVLIVLATTSLVVAKFATSNASANSPVVVSDKTDQ